MNEKDVKKYMEYNKIKERGKANWIEKIKFWDMLYEEYIITKREFYKKCDKVESLKQELSAYKIKSQILEEEIETLKSKRTPTA